MSKVILAKLHWNKQECLRLHKPNTTSFKATDWYPSIICVKIKSAALQNRVIWCIIWKWRQIKVTFQIRSKVGLFGLIWKALWSWIQNRNRKNSKSCSFPEIFFQKFEEIRDNLPAQYAKNSPNQNECPLSKLDLLKKVGKAVPLGIVPYQNKIF